MCVKRTFPCPECGAACDLKSLNSAFSEMGLRLKGGAWAKLKIWLRYLAEALRPRPAGPFRGTQAVACPKCGWAGVITFM